VATRRGFTLVELLVVIGIIAVLISILLPTLNRVRESGNQIKCRANLTQMGTALRMYANDNRDHFPNPESVGDSPASPFAYAFRRGINEPDPTTPSTVETRGLPNLLYNQKYLKAIEVWICPSNGGRNTSLAQLNTYCWNVSALTSGYTSKQRNSIPLLNGAPSIKDWWYIQDNVFYAVKSTNVMNTSTSVVANNPFAPPTPTSLNFWYMPHQYRAKRINSQDNRLRQGATNVLFLDGSTGMFIYTSSSGFSPQEVIRGE
jgi:prepilin-type N-terminal cleavage/methylation domain-containing protein/prepilin-type processing-associated H-X9-DG protein